MKRLRRKYDQVVRFYMCGEYGEGLLRPHYHACLFNLDFRDRVPWGTTEAGSQLWRSAELERLWSHGFSTVGELTFESAAYAARYVVDKINGGLARVHYSSVDIETGELFFRQPEFNHMSLKPGIGAGWYERWRSDVYPHDYVVVNGKEVKPPKYYDRRLKAELPEMWERVQSERVEDAVPRFADNSPARLAVKAVVARARLSLSKRKMK